MHISAYVVYSDLALRSPNRTFKMQIMDPVHLIRGPNAHTSQQVGTFPLVRARVMAYDGGAEGWTGMENLKCTALTEGFVSRLDKGRLSRLNQTHRVSPAS